MAQYPFYGSGTVVDFTLHRMLPVIRGIFCIICFLNVVSSPVLNCPYHGT